jgi:Double zinc ribbon
VTDVERFFRRLVDQLAATDPGRLRRPVALDEIYRDILPYRAHRRALQLDTSEEYELVLLRLCAGEGGLVETEPEEARSRFVQELRSPNPDLDVLRSFEDVQVTIRPEPLMRALDPPAEPPRAEPEPALVLGAAQFEDLPGIDLAPPLEEVEEPADEPVEEPVAEAAPICVYCGGWLPTNRTVNFCPHCGQSQTQILCPECRSEVEPGWRHCVNCGAAVGEG